MLELGYRPAAVRDLLNQPQEFGSMIHAGYQVLLLSNNPGISYKRLARPALSYVPPPTIGAWRPRVITRTRLSAACAC